VTLHIVLNDDVDPSTNASKMDAVLRAVQKPRSTPKEDWVPPILSVAVENMYNIWENKHYDSGLKNPFQELYDMLKIEEGR